MMTAAQTAIKPTSLLWQFDAEQLEQHQAQFPNAVHLVGIDEVGRGSWIGPVVVAAVCLPASALEHSELVELNDSKKLRPSRRDALFEVITSVGHVGIDWVSIEELTTLNIYQASRLGFYRALSSLINQTTLPTESILALVDGKAMIPDWPKEQQQTVIKGDGKSAVIAAASIVAKVTRDNWAIEQSQRYPGYSWETNMGYGTRKHQQAVQTQGITPLHRPNFRFKSQSS